MRRRVALVGRQNVGKSTLVNRIVGGREAIAHEAPGVTRDRVERDATWSGRSFALVDTGGYVRGATGIERLVGEQASRASESADVVVIVVDARTGPTSEDLEIARGLRRADRPVIVAVNKVDDRRDEAEVAAFHRLGLGEPIGVSALQGRGIGELLDRVVALLPADDEDADAEDAIPAFALVGRPNVGKSSLFNRIVGEERSVVYEKAGTTRDAVDAVVTWPSGEVRFVDTAGLRRAGGGRATGVDYYSFLRTERAIERADVACLVIDAVEGMTTEDRRIASRVLELGRGLLIVANKWDLVEERELRFAMLRRAGERNAGAAVVRTSARSGVGVTRLPRVLVDLHDRYISRAPTSRVTALVERAQDARPGPVRYRYASQVSTAPPTFVLFGGRAPSQTYERYLENRIREAFHLEGIPVRLRFRAKRDRSGSRPGA